MTRAEISGALQVLNANGTRNRAKAVQAMLSPKFAAPVVNRILADLKSYPEWAARLDLEDAEVPRAAASAPADPKPPAAKPKKKGKGG